MRFSVVALAVLLTAVGSVQPLAAQQGAADSVRRDSTRSGNAFTLPPIVFTATVEPVRQDRIGFSSSILSTADFTNDPAALAAQMLRRLIQDFLRGSYVGQDAESRFARPWA